MALFRGRLHGFNQSYTGLYREVVVLARKNIVLDSVNHAVKLLRKLA